MFKNKGADAYRSNMVRNQAEVASPFHLVQLVFKRLMEVLSEARLAAERINSSESSRPDDIQALNECFKRSVDMLDALNEALDHEVGGEVSQNLSRIYLFCKTKVNDGFCKTDPALFGEAAEILKPIKQAWDQLGEVK